MTGLRVVVVVGTTVVEVVAVGVDVVDLGAVVDVVADATVVVVELVVAAHVGTLTVLVSSVTAPLRASTRPLTCAPVSSVMEVSAMIEPLNWLVAPNVAELPTCQ